MDGIFLKTCPFGWEKAALLCVFALFFLIFTIVNRNL